MRALQRVTMLAVASFTAWYAGVSLLLVARRTFYTERPSDVAVLVGLCLLVAALVLGAVALGVSVRELLDRLWRRDAEPPLKWRRVFARGLTVVGLGYTLTFAACYSLDQDFVYFPVGTTPHCHAIDVLKPFQPLRFLALEAGVPGGDRPPVRGVALRPRSAP